MNRKNLKAVARGMDATQRAIRATANNERQGMSDEPERARVARVEMWELVDLMLQDKTRDAEALLSTVSEEGMRALTASAVAGMVVVLEAVFKGGARAYVAENLAMNGVHRGR